MNEITKSLVGMFGNVSTEKPRYRVLVIPAHRFDEGPECEPPKPTIYAAANGFDTESMQWKRCHTENQGNYFKLISFWLPIHLISQRIY